MKQTGFAEAREDLPVIEFLRSRRKEEVELRNGKDKNDSVSQVMRRVLRMVGVGQVYHPEDNTGLESILDVTRISNYIQTCIKECNMKLNTAKNYYSDLAWSLKTLQERADLQTFWPKLKPEVSEFG